MVKEKTLTAEKVAAKPEVISGLVPKDKGPGALNAFEHFEELCLTFAVPEKLFLFLFDLFLT